MVANKYQTGFDEPLLHTMYVDKKLDGVQAVQTLSRLNRTREAKTETLVLDFVNEAEDMQAAFQPYYQTTLLEEETDPNKLYDHQTELKAYEVFTDADVNEFAEVFFKPNVPLEKLQPVLDRVRLDLGLQARSRNAKTSAPPCRNTSAYTASSPRSSPLKMWTWKSSTSSPKPSTANSPAARSRLPYEIRDGVDLDSFRLQETYSGSIELEKEQGVVPGFGDGSLYSTEDEKDLLSHIITTLNETYGLNLTEDDKVDMQHIRTRLEADEGLQAVLNADNPRDAKVYKFNQVLDRLLLEFVHTKLDLYKKLTEPKVNEMLKRQWYEGLAR